MTSQLDAAIHGIPKATFRGCTLRRLIPRFTIRTLLIATALVAFTTPFLVAQLRRAWNNGGDVIVSGDTSPPDDGQIRAALEQNGAALPSSLPVYMELCTDYVDKPFRLPLLGSFQRRHRHYMCGIPSKANAVGILPVRIKTSELLWKGGS